MCILCTNEWQQIILDVEYWIDGIDGKSAEG